MAYIPQYTTQSVFGSVFTYPQANQSVSGTAQIIGTTSIGGADTTGNFPVKIGGYALAGVPSTVGANTIATGWFGTHGAIMSGLIGPLSSAGFDGTNTGQLLSSSGQTTNPIGIAAHVFNGVNWDRLRGNSSVGALVYTGSGSVVTVQGGTRITSISGSLSASILGAIPVTQSTSPWVISSINGTYAEDTGHSSGSLGLFTLGVRNDAVASFVSADLEYTPIGVDSAGRTITRPFAAEESRIEGYHSVVSTSVTTLVAAAGAGLRNYITDFFIVNSGGITTPITFQDGAGSILGYTIAPAYGGSNATNIATPIRTGANASFDFKPTSASSIIYATVKGYKGP